MNATVIPFPMTNRLVIVAGQPKYTKRPAVIYLSGPKHPPLCGYCALCDKPLNHEDGRCRNCGYHNGCGD